MLLRGRRLASPAWHSATSLAGQCARTRALTGGPPISPEAMAQALAADPEKLEAFVSALPPEQKKLVGLRWAMAELEDEFAKADRDADGHLTYAEFYNWANRTVRGDGPTDAEAQVTPAQLRALGVQNMVPFISFGLVDNSLMVISGDFIDGTIGVALGITTLAAAALGNAFSNSMGMFLHGFIDRFANQIGLPDPRLTVSQRHARSVKNVKMASGVLGVMIGCVLGAPPTHSAPARLPPVTSTAE